MVKVKSHNRRRIGWTKTTQSIYGTALEWDINAITVISNDGYTGKEFVEIE